MNSNMMSKIKSGKAKYIGDGVYAWPDGYDTVVLATYDGVEIGDVIYMTNNMLEDAIRILENSTVEKKP